MMMNMNKMMSMGTCHNQFFAVFFKYIKTFKKKEPNKKQTFIWS